MSSKLKTSRGYVICINAEMPVHRYVDSCTTMSKFVTTDDIQFALRVKTSAQANQLRKELAVPFLAELCNSSVIPCPYRMDGEYPTVDIHSKGEATLSTVPPEVPPAKPLDEFFVIEGSHGMWVSSDDKYSWGTPNVSWTSDPSLCMAFTSAQQAATYLTTSMFPRVPSSINCSITRKTFSENEGLIPQFVIKNMFNRMYLGLSSDDVLRLTKDESLILFWGTHAECQEFFLEVLEDDTRSYILEDCKVVERIQESMDVAEEAASLGVIPVLAPAPLPLGILDQWEVELKILKQQLFDLGSEAHTHRYSILSMEALRLSMCISDLQRVLLKP